MNIEQLIMSNEQWTRTMNDDQINNEQRTIIN